MIVKKVDIKINNNKQQVFIGYDLDIKIQEVLNDKNYSNIVFIVDKRIMQQWPKKIDWFAKYGKIFQIEPKPYCKDFKYCKNIIDLLVANKVNRRSCLVAVGGGYVGDIVGFVASIYMRGIDFIQISTTFMAMSDPIVGKVAINFSGLKNILGSFNSPIYTFCDLRYLDTLKIKEIDLGLVEVWKTALVTNDIKVQSVINKLLKSNKYGNKILADLIFMSIKSKKYYVSKDWDDKKGPHKALSLGHTFSNYLEGKFKMRHGEGVCYGILMSAILSNELGKISSLKYEQIKYTFSLFNSKFNLLKRLQNRIVEKNVIKEIGFDKINVNKNKYAFVLLTPKGFSVNIDISTKDLRKTIQVFRKLNVVL